LGAKEIAEAWKTMFNPKNLLDVGCGRGTFLTYARDVGIEAEGFDFSVWSIKNRYNRCKPEWLRVHDANKPWPYADKSFELVVALDFWEHIYQEDLQFVMDEMFRVAGKWVFLQIAVAGSGGLQGRSDKGYAFAKGQKVPVELEGCAVAGHVTVQPENFWYDKFERDDWLVRRDMVNWFVALVNPAIIKNWVLNLIVVLERI
jgi:SAM-dependent methyltransferase